MEQADAKHCPKSEAGEKHDRHSWRDEYGVYSCDGDILSADDVFALLGIRRGAIDGDVPMFDTMDVSHILPKAEAINLLFGEPRNSLKHLKLNTEDLFPVEFGPVEEMTGPSYSPNDPLFAVAEMQKYLASQMDIPVDHLMGPKSEFALRTHGWTEQQLREALYAKEQECIELKMLLSKFGDRVERVIAKMMGKLDKINAR